ncbi:hypothetical membrane protein [Pseudomonas knackmussii B13]|uniref:Hypothetical membrane protein n=1 Tax=Pseudomonas knackmussii (strain DSM 6978 / CCUG 54928 / LMG 23759 / B13) TaxID=1301098 RepID=A0A024H9J6_PSEKB|nr:hypothetical membrane protein [Pseudomonas knackmussii B13]
MRDLPLDPATRTGASPSRLLPMVLASLPWIVVALLAWLGLPLWPLLLLGCLGSLAIG